MKSWNNFEEIFQELLDKNIPDTFTLHKDSSQGGYSGFVIVFLGIFGVFEPEWSEYSLFEKKSKAKWTAILKSKILNSKNP